MLRHSSIILCACAWASWAHAQAPCVDSSADSCAVARHDSCADDAEAGTFGLEVDALAFFKDNEFDGDVVKGYSLPGFRLQPRLTYTPLREVHLEAGFHATVFEGAGKYPAYVFHDIAHWKGNQYTSGAHVLPFFRAEARLGQHRPGRTTIVLGDIYGAEAHALALPLYNPELTLSDDPEAGMQVLVSRRRWTSDLWLNWQSYIYEEDTHQEAFTVGWTQHLGTPSDGDCGRPAGAGRSFWGMPLQVVVQHRGGEQDLPELDLGVQTIANGAVGVDYEWRRTPTSMDGLAPVFRPSMVTSVRCEALALAALQQSGHLWPFDAGAAFWTSASVGLFCGLNVKAGLFYAPHDFCSLYGSPFFGTLSVKHPGTRYDGMTTGYWCAEYARTFTHKAHRSHGTYTLGAKVDGYVNGGRAPFSFGLYFRATPSYWFK